MNSDLARMEIRKDYIKLRQRAVVVWASFILLGVVVLTGCFVMVIHTLDHSKLTQNEFLGTVGVLVTGILGLVRLVIRAAMNGNGKHKGGR